MGHPLKSLGVLYFPLDMCVALIKALIMGHPLKSLGVLYFPLDMCVALIKAGADINVKVNGKSFLESLESLESDKDENFKDAIKKAIGRKERQKRKLLRFNVNKNIDSKKTTAPDAEKKDSSIPFDKPGY